MTVNSSGSELLRQLRGERLTTTEVLYYMPDHPALLQRFLWQTLDLAPDFPRVHRFLDFWRAEIEAVIHSVTVSAAGLMAPARLEVSRSVGVLN
ncbi:protein usg [Caulobacter sp. KR2-114]|uniref:protein usg n=1 Tax=Caulobacter sp. KR2-114 TaxID=3400912 RepID=UPI003C0AADC1